MSHPIRIGISSCLLGQEVRYDGGHKRDRFLTDTLGNYVEWVPVCPEMEMGLGTPREAMRLVRDDRGRVRMSTIQTGIDHSDRMQTWARRRLRELETADLCGYVFKSKSPSCGMERVRVFEARRMVTRTGRGLFAEALIERFPMLPVEEEGRLEDPRLRDNFIERVFAYRRLKDLFHGRWSVGDLVRFHTVNKMALLAHSTTGYTALGRIVAAAKRSGRKVTRGQYERLFMETLATLATPRRHANVLMHMAGHLKTHLDTASKQELLDCIDEYRRELVPLVVPITLVRHYVRALGIAYLANQTYLQPHPRELMLRNHV